MTEPVTQDASVAQKEEERETRFGKELLSSFLSSSGDNIAGACGSPFFVL